MPTFRPMPNFTNPRHLHAKMLTHGVFFDTCQILSTYATHVGALTHANFYEAMPPTPPTSKFRPTPIF